MFLPRSFEEFRDEITPDYLDPARSSHTSGGYLSRNSPSGSPRRMAARGLQEWRRSLIIRSMFFMHNRPLVRLLLAVWMLLEVGALSATPTTHAKFAGTYASRAKDDTKPGPTMDLSLGLDGTATVTEDAGNGAVTHFGHWAETNGQVKVSFDPVQGTSAEPPMTLQAEHDGLRAIAWNHTTWARPRRLS